MSYENAQRLYDRQIPDEDPLEDEMERELADFERRAMRGETSWIECLDENERAETLEELWKALRAPASRPAPQRFCGWLRRVFFGGTGVEVEFHRRAEAIFGQAFKTAEAWYAKMERERLDRGFP